MELLNEQAQATGYTSMEFWEEVFGPENTYPGVNLESIVKIKRQEETSKRVNANRERVKN